MTEIDKKLALVAHKEKLDQLMRHIHHVQAAARMLGERLIMNGEPEFGQTLIANSMTHDQSKFNGIEWDAIGGFNDDVSDDVKKLAINQHQHTNSHHPEFWGGISNMPRIYVAEMVCDWYARSVEFGTDLRQWIKETACSRFDMSLKGKVYKWIKEFVDLLLEKFS